MFKLGATINQANEDEVAGSDRMRQRVDPGGNCGFQPLCPLPSLSLFHQLISPLKTCPTHNTDDNQMVRLCATPSQLIP